MSFLNNKYFIMNRTDYVRCDLCQAAFSSEAHLENHKMTQHDNEYECNDFNERNLCITEKLSNQGFRYHKLIKTFAKFFRSYKDLVLKLCCTCNNLIRIEISQPKFMVTMYIKLVSLSTILLVSIII